MNINCCNTALNAISVDAQTLEANNSIVFSVNTIDTGNQINHAENSQVISIIRPGIYLINFSASLLGTAAEVVTVNMLNKGIPLQGALASATTAVGETTNVAFSYILCVPRSCMAINNSASLTFTVNNAVTVSSSTVSVVRIP